LAEVKFHQHGYEFGAQQHIARIHTGLQIQSQVFGLSLLPAPIGEHLYLVFEWFGRGDVDMEEVQF
jgi:hypothetical protein